MDNVSRSEAMLDLARPCAENRRFAERACNRLHARVADAATDATATHSTADPTADTVFRAMPLDCGLLVQRRLPVAREMLLRRCMAR
jgi:hypothetical protein